jgi:phage-related baseplate assembly protein
MQPIIDLSTLAPPQVVEALDYEAIRADMVADLRARLPEWEADLESDPAVKIIEVAAYREMLLRARVNDAARALLLAYAVGANLEHRAASVQVARLDGETDARLRVRAQQGFAALAAAGPAAAYRRHALDVSNEITDVSVVMLTPGVVTVTVLAADRVPQNETTEDEIAQAAQVFPALTAPSGEAVVIGDDHAPLLDHVRRVFAREEVTPLTDSVVVRAPTILTFEIEAVLTLFPGPDETLVRTGALQRLNAYLASVRKLDHDATRSGIIGALHAPGVQNVVLVSPAQDVVTSALDLALCMSTNVTVAGRDV